MAVMTLPQRTPMTLEDFTRLPEGPPFYDYMNGEAVEVNRPTGRHQQIEMRLANCMWEHTRANSLGEVYTQIDVALPTGDIVGPDIVFLSRERMAQYDEEKGDLYGAPDLAVEILSPSNAAYDRVEKFGKYERSQVGWVWFVEQESLAIEEYRWTPEGYLRTGAALGGEAFTSKLFPDLAINLKELTGF